MITQENSYWLLIISGIGAFIVGCILIWGFWPVVKRIRLRSPIYLTNSNREYQTKSTFEDTPTTGSLRWRDWFESKYGEKFRKHRATMDEPTEDEKDQ